MYDFALAIEIVPRSLWLIVHLRGRKHPGRLRRWTARCQTQDTYMRHVNVARVALKIDRGALQTPNLATQRRCALSGWLVDRIGVPALSLSRQACIIGC